MSIVTFKDVSEVEGVPVPLYRLTYKGETLAICTKATEAIEWLRHPYRQTAAYACYSDINGVQKEILRNGGARA